jgi:hypothetical protein
MTNNTLHKINETLGDLIDELDTASWLNEYANGKRKGLQIAKVIIEQYLFNEREEGGENVD